MTGSLATQISQQGIVFSPINIVLSPSNRLWMKELSDHRVFADILSCFRRAIIVFSPMTYRAFADKEAR
ncbi:MAG: hypothetical protein ACYDIC_12870 [Desulfobaccales bacterium]